MASAESALITVVVVTFRGLDILPDCLVSLAGQSMAHELLIVDNASVDGTAELLRTDFPTIRVLRLQKNLGFAGGVAAGLHLVRTPYIALLNDDAAADPQWLSELYTTIDRSPGTAAVTSEMWLTDPVGTLNNLGVALTAGGYGYDIGLGCGPEAVFERPTPTFGFSGGAAMIRTEELRAVGGAPADFFLYYEDVDMSWRLRLAGHQILSVPTARVVHQHSATVGQTSIGFHRFNELNRLRTLLRCAPLSVFLGQFLRFGVTTVSLAGRKLLRQPVPKAANFSVRLRLGVVGEVVLLLPRLVRQRQIISRSSRLSRRQVAAQWMGAAPYPDTTAT